MRTLSACGLMLTFATGCASAPPKTSSRDVPKIESTVSAEPSTKAPPKPPEAPAGPRYEMRPLATIAAGADFSCAIAKAQVRCWGNNREGALGDGTKTPRHQPVTVLGVSGASELAAGAGSACARSNEEVRCWGQLAKGGPPVEITGLVKPQRIATHGQRGCAIEAAGSVRCWDTDELASYPIAAIDAGVGIAIGSEGACVRERHGTVKCWKDGRPKRVKGLSNVVELAMADAGSYDRHACARTSDHAVHCWKMDKDPEPAPQEVVSARRVVLGSQFGCIANDIGELSCWKGPYGGSSHYISGDSVQRHGRILGASDVTAGRQHLCQRLPSGEVFCMGNNAEGQLGVPGAITDEPLAIAITDAQSLSSSSRATCAVRNSGEAHCWGNVYTRHEDRPFLERTRVEDAKGIGVLARSNNHSCAIVGRTVSCWGSGSRGELGAESAPPPKKKSPFARSLISSRAVRRVKGIAGPTDVAVTDSSSCVVVGGTVRCWGRSGLAPKSAKTSSFDQSYGFSSPCSSYGKDEKRCSALQQPRTVPGLRGVKEIAADDTGLCARTANAVWCWDASMLANGGKPTKVAGLSKPTHLAMGYRRVCAVDGSAVVCRKWTQAMRPLDPLPKGTTVVSIAVGDAHTCVATSTGEVLCTGGGDDGQLGDGRRQSAFGTWVTATSLTGAVEVVAGRRHTCSRSQNGALHCWGAPPKMVAAERATPFTMTPQRVEGL